MQLPTVQPCDSYTVVFEAVRGPTYRSDIAIDDITVRPGLCPSYGQYCLFVLAAETDSVSHCIVTSTKVTWQ